MTRRLNDFVRGVCIGCALALFSAGTVCAKAKAKDKDAAAAKSSKAYSDADAADYELQAVRKLLPKEPVKALWRARLLLDTAAGNAQVESLYGSCTKKVVSLYKKAVEAKNFVDALRYYGSLQAAGYGQLASLPMDAARLRNAISTSVPGLSAKDASSGGKVSSMIDGTVTVYVDKGIKVERGVGYNDGVLGSGFFVSRNGYIITNHHVISDCVDPTYKGFARLYIKLAEDSDTRIPAKIIGYDKGVDLALLKVEVDAPYVFALGSSTDLDVGDKVFAIGSPLGLERTLTSGIVSSKDRELFSSGKVFQIDAAVNSGNSGGPLIDEQGRVQAVVFAGVQNYQGLNFAIPVEYLRSELPILCSGGERLHPWMSLYGKTKRSPGAGSNEGVYVHYVMPGGSAKLSGIVVGDVIESVDGEPVLSTDDLSLNFLQRCTDSIVTVGVLRADGSREQLPVYLDVRPDYPGYDVYTHDTVAQAFVPLVGMHLLQASSMNKKKFTVQGVIKGSIADSAGFDADDQVEVIRVEISDDKSQAGVQISARKRQSGFVDTVLGIGVPLDSPYYF